MAQLKDTIINGSLIINDKPFFDWLYPVGCLYWSSKSTDPGTLFAGTKWKQITDKFIFAQGNKAVDTEGGHENIKLTVEQLPSHTHNISHTHKLKPNGKLTSLSFSGKETSTKSESGHTHSISHTHKLISSASTTSGPEIQNLSEGHICRSAAFSSSSYNYAICGTWTGPTLGKSSEPSSSSSGGGTSHSHNFTPSGTVSGSFEGLDTTTSSQSTTISDSTGSGSNINIMPPYIVKYCWERTA